MYLLLFRLNDLLGGEKLLFLDDEVGDWRFQMYLLDEVGVLKGKDWYRHKRRGRLDRLERNDGVAAGLKL